MQTKPRNRRRNRWKRGGSKRIKWERPGNSNHFSPQKPRASFLVHEKPRDSRESSLIRVIRRWARNPAQKRTSWSTDSKNRLPKTFEERCPRQKRERKRRISALKLRKKTKPKTNGIDRGLRRRQKHPTPNEEDEEERPGSRGWVYGGREKEKGWRQVGNLPTRNDTNETSFGV